MKLTEWAKREIDLACKKENPKWDGESFDYGCACYQSAYKAFKSICEDGHSGFSIQATKDILNRLIDGKPLTAIEDTPDEWEDKGFDSNDGITYQNKRMFSLFKTIHKDGSVSYSDNDSYIAYEEGKEYGFTWKFIGDVFYELFPVKMPYYPPTRPYKVYVKEFLYNPKYGDFDTVGILYIIAPDGKRIEVNRFYKETDNGFIRICEKEYQDRLDSQKS